MANFLNTTSSGSKKPKQNSRLLPRKVSRKYRTKQLVSEHNVKALVRTQSGRPATLVVAAEDEFEKVGILEYETGIREVRRRASFNNRFEEDCALGKCTVYNRIISEDYTLGDITHVKSCYHPKVPCENGKDCIFWRALLTGSFQEAYLAHSAIFIHPPRTWVRKFPALFSYFNPIPDRAKTGLDPVYSFCHGFNDQVFQDPYCEDYQTQNPKEALEEFLIEIRENGMDRILHRDNEDLLEQLREFMIESEYLRRLENPLELHHILAIILFTDSALQFEYCSHTFRHGILDEKWKHFFCVMMEAVTILAQNSPLVGQHVHVCSEGILPIDKNQSIQTFILGSKSVLPRFGDKPHTVYDIYLPHQHHKVGSKNVCAGVVDVGWLSRFTTEELVIIMPGQCFIPESCDVEENQCSIYGTLRGNCIVKKGQEQKSAIVEEITINFGTLTAADIPSQISDDVSLTNSDMPSVPSISDDRSADLNSMALYDSEIVDVRLPDDIFESEQVAFTPQINSSAPAISDQDTLSVDKKGAKLNTGGGVQINSPAPTNNFEMIKSALNCVE